MSKRSKKYPQIGRNEGIEVNIVDKEKPGKKTVRRNIDYGELTWKRLELAADELNVSAQAIVKLVLEEWLNKRDLAKGKDKKGA